jgi:hypothetical protein
MHTKQITKPTKELIDELTGLITQGIECWQKAGELVVQLLDKHSMTTAQIAGSSPYLTENLVARFEQLGRKQIVPRLLIAEFPAARYIIKLPYSEQRRVLEAPVDLLLITPTGADTLQTPVENLTPQQCRQVFNGSHVRNLGAQRTYLEESRMQQEPLTLLPAEPPYKIRGKRIIFTQPCEMTARQLAQILTEVE